MKIEEFARRICAALELQDAAGIVTVQGDNLDQAYVQKWIEDLELAEQWQAVRELAGERNQ